MTQPVYYKAIFHGLKKEEKETYFTITKTTTIEEGGEEKKVTTTVLNTHKKRNGKENPYFNTEKHHKIGGKFIGIKFVMKESENGPQELAILRFEKGGAVMNLHIWRNRQLRRFIECFPKDSIMGNDHIFLVAFHFPGTFTDKITEEERNCRNKGFSVYKNTIEKHNKIAPLLDEDRQRVESSLYRKKNKRGSTIFTDWEPLDEYLKSAIVSTRRRHIVEKIPQNTTKEIAFNM